MPFCGSDRGVRMGKLIRTMLDSTAESCLTSYRKLPGWILAVLLILSCSGYPVRSDHPRGVYHLVKKGETLYSIARAYRVDLQELAEINNVGDPDRIETGSVIFVPEANQILDDVMTAAGPVLPAVTPAGKQEPGTVPEVVLKAETLGKKEEPKPSDRRREPSPIDPTTKDRIERPRAEKGEPVPPRAIDKPEKKKVPDPLPKPRQTGKEEEQLRFEKKRFIWPVRGKVLSHFGIQPNRMYYNGIRIEAVAGTAVQAAADGMVIFSAPLKDYGETIIIQHEEQYATVYTNLGLRIVQGESRVKKGDRIAFVGQPNAQGEPYLHFEIRHRNKARNPLFFLP